MRHVARKTPFIRFDRSVLENEWSHGVRVTFGADRELPGGGSDLVTGLRAVRIVAVAALNEPDIYAMPVRPREFRFLCRMAAIAQSGLLFHQQKIHIGRPVRTMTGRTTDAVGQVFRVGKVLRFQTGLVALRTDRRCLGRTQGFETNDLGEVAAAIHVSLCRTVASLAAMLVALKQRGMRRPREVLVPDFLVAGLANLGVCVLAACRSGQRGRCWVSRCAWVLLCSQRDSQAARHEKCRQE